MLQPTNNILLKVTIQHNNIQRTIFQLLILLKLQETTNKQFCLTAIINVQGNKHIIYSNIQQLYDMDTEIKKKIILLFWTLHIEHSPLL